MQLGMTLVRKRAVEKTSQALREGQPKLRQQMVELGDVAGVTAGVGGGMQLMPPPPPGAGTPVVGAEEYNSKGLMFQRLRLPDLQ